MQRLEREQADRRARVHQLEAEVAALSSLDRVERAARERLGMVPAPKIRYLDVAIEPPAGLLLPGPFVVPEAAAAPKEGTSWWDRLLRASPLE
jgi:hypothetical protein